MSEEKSYQIKRTLDKDEKVPGWQRGKKYKSLLKSVATLAKDETLEITVEKQSIVSYIRKLIDRAFEHNKYKVMQRKRDDEIYCYIKKVN